MKGMRSRSVYSDEMNDAAARRCHVEEAATPRPLSSAMPGFSTPLTLLVVLLYAGVAAR
jgi:hypothetical protein